MKEQSIIEVGESRPRWEALEAYARAHIQHWLQQLLEEEVEEALGRERYERRQRVDAPRGYRNGWGKPRRLSLMSGTIRPWRGWAGTWPTPRRANCVRFPGSSGCGPKRSKSASVRGAGRFGRGRGSPDLRRRGGGSLPGA